MANILVTLLALSPALQAAPASSQPVGLDLLDEAWSSPEVAAPRMDRDDVLRRSEPQVPPPESAAQPAGGYGWVRTSLSLGGVVALIVLMAWGYRLVTSAGGRLSLGVRPRHPGLIQVLSRATLSPRQSICLVRVGPQLILVGATQEQLNTLSVINDPELAAHLAGQEARQHRDGFGARFQGLLDREASAYDAAQAQDAPPDSERLTSIREKLASAVQRLRAGNTT